MLLLQINDSHVLEKTGSGNTRHLLIHGSISSLALPSCDRIIENTFSPLDKAALEKKYMKGIQASYLIRDVIQPRRWETVFFPPKEM